MNLRSSAFRYAVVAVAIGMLCLLSFPGITTSSDENKPRQTPQKSTASRSASASQDGKRPLTKGPYARKRLVEDAPRIGETGRVPSGILNQLGLSDKEASLAEAEIVKMRQRMIQLVLDHATVEKDEEKAKLTINILPFELSANGELNRLQEALNQLLGREKAAALFSYLDTEGEFSAYGKLPIQITFEPEKKERQLVIRYHKTLVDEDKTWGGSGRIFEDSMDWPSLISGYDDAFDRLITEFFTPFFRQRRLDLQKEDEVRRALSHEREAAADLLANNMGTFSALTGSEVITFSNSLVNSGLQSSSLFPSGTDKFTSTDLPVSQELQNASLFPRPTGGFPISHTIEDTEHNQTLQRLKSAIREETRTRLAERTHYDHARSRPDDGYEVYSVRADLDLGDTLLKEQRETLEKLFPEKVDRDARLDYWSYERFPYGTVHLSRDALVEVTKNPDGTIEKVVVKQTDAETGTCSLKRASSRRTEEGEIAF